MLGFLRPESIGATYKTPYFGGNEVFRVFLPSTIDKLFLSLPKSWIVGVPGYIASISPFVVMWDFKWLQVQRSPGSQVHNLCEYRELQLLVLIIRFLGWTTIRYITDAVVVMWITGFLGIISLIVYTLGF